MILDTSFHTACCQVSMASSSRHFRIACREASIGCFGARYFQVSEFVVRFAPFRWVADGDFCALCLQSCGLISRRTRFHNCNGSAVHPCKHSVSSALFSRLFSIFSRIFLKRHLGPLARWAVIVAFFCSHPGSPEDGVQLYLVSYTTLLSSWAVFLPFHLSQAISLIEQGESKNHKC